MKTVYARYQNIAAGKFVAAEADIESENYNADEWANLNDVEKAVGMFYKNWNSSIYEKYLKEFNLARDKKVKDLSRGMRMKLMIAVAFSHEAKLLILDEPTSGLDPVARDEFLDILRDYIEDEEKSVIFSSHITSDIEKIADYITYINNGKIIFTGEKDEFLEKYCIIKGGKEDITESQKKEIIGLRMHSTGFEGLIELKKAVGFSSKVIIEKASLDEIMIYMNKEAM